MLGTRSKNITFPLGALPLLLIQSETLSFIYCIYFPPAFVFTYLKYMKDEL